MSRAGFIARATALGLATLLVACAAGAAPAGPATVPEPAAASAGAGAVASAEAASASAPVPAAPPAWRHVLAGMTQYSASYMDELAALDKGYFREVGLDVESMLAGGWQPTP